MSPREFDGWTPIEVHEHFDNDDQRTGYTVITRESAWNDESRGRALRLAEYEDDLCTCGCNLPREVAHDSQQTFVVDTIRCHARRALTRVQRADDDKHEKDQSPGWDDGLFYYVRPYKGD